MGYLLSNINLRLPRLSPLQWALIGGGGAVAVGIGVVAYKQRRRPSVPSPPTPTPTPTVEAMVVKLGAGAPKGDKDEPDEIERESGHIRRDMDGGGYSSTHLDKREIYVGPLLQKIPKGMILRVDYELFVEGQPPPLPGGPALPCASYGEVVEYSRNLNRGDSYEQFRDGCTELHPQPGISMSFAWPHPRLVKKSDGIYFVYRWTNFRVSPESAVNFQGKDYRLILRWETLPAN